MAEKFSRIALTAWRHAQRAPVELARIVAWLRDHGFEVLLDEATAEMAGERDGLGRAEAVRGAELVIVIGGDGSMLRTAHLIEGEAPLLLGINTGHLGFLADISLDNIFPALEGILLERQYTVEARMRLRPAARRDGQTVPLHDVLNDVVLTAGPLARMVRFRVRVGERHLGDFRGDGLILATPTGSTAYSLSAGGPLVMPDLKTMIINPICPHTLSNRPIVVSAESKVEVSIFPDFEAEGRHILLTLDGHPGCELMPEDAVTVFQSPHPIRLVRPAGADHFQVLRDKLSWETHPRGDKRA